jgi:hypothetical protein
MDKSRGFDEIGWTGQIFHAAPDDAGIHRVDFPRELWLVRGGGRHRQLAVREPGAGDTASRRNDAGRRSTDGFVGA